MIDSMELTQRLYESLATADKMRPMERWHASSIASCPRAQYFARLGINRIAEPTGAKVLRWRAGHLIEEAIRPELVKQYPNLVSNVRFESDELDLTGEIDNYDPDTKTLIEIKSVSGHAVKYKKVADTRHHLRDNGPYLHHEWQQHAYVHLLKEKSLPVERIIYLYITLDGLLVPYETLVKAEILEAVDYRLAGLNSFWKSQEPPPCFCADESDKFYKPVNAYCNYRTEAGCCPLTLMEMNR